MVWKLRVQYHFVCVAISNNVVYFKSGSQLKGNFINLNHQFTISWIASQKEKTSTTNVKLQFTWSANTTFHPVLKLSCFSCYL